MKKPVYDEIHLTIEQSSKMFGIVRAALREKRIGLEDIFNSEQPFYQIYIVVGDVWYLYKLSVKEDMLRMYVYYDGAFDGKEPVFSYYWYMGPGSDVEVDSLDSISGYIQRPAPGKGLDDIMDDWKVRRDFMCTYFIVGYLVKTCGDVDAGSDEIGGERDGGVLGLTSRKNKVSVTECVKDKHGGKRYKNVVYLNKVYTFEKLDALNLNKGSLKKVFKCLCWGVRGHYRKQIVYEGNEKIVRLVYVRPYRKGVKRNDERYYTDKEYNLDSMFNAEAIPEKEQR